ncbi:flagellar export chaperone FliS [bacterium]|nr:flagellar export chaperone FliS [bacterium]MBU1884229.1 flagellar export chaperone FliS [bacterium]
MYQTNAYNTYAQNNVGIESPQKLIEMLYEGILRFNTQAKRAIKDNDIEKRTYWINRSNAIFIELINTLDINQGDVSMYLHGLYTYQLNLLSKANIENNDTYIMEVNQVVRGLLDAWREETNVAQ